MTPSLRGRDALLVVIGLVVGAGIFKTPALVVADAGAWTLGLWVAGGGLSVLGALCYAEMAAAHPDGGGDYRFLERAFGRDVAFMFGWSRVAVLQTGSLAILAFLFGDYAARLLSGASSAVFAAGLVLALAAVQANGLQTTARVQGLLTGTLVGGLGLLAGAALFCEPAAQTPAPPGSAGARGLGTALVFVMLTFGGWSEAAYLSADLRRGALLRALLGGLGLVTGVYLLVNLACLRALGPHQMAGSDAVVADLAHAVAGAPGLHLTAVLVALSAATSANAVLLTGARSLQALGRDFPPLGFLAPRDGRGTPRRALSLQAGLALLAVGGGAAAPDGFAALVEFTAPVFWFFLFLAGVAVFVLRSRRSAPAAFEVPLYPWTPALFCASSLALLWSSLAYTGTGALVGVAVTLAGLPLLLLWRTRVAPPRDP